MSIEINRDLNRSIPAFIEKLYSILQDDSIKELISWSDDGKSFGVKQVTEFSNQVLPKHFKHNNWQSFVRQLNMYGFNKIADSFHLCSSSSWRFRHPSFQQGKPELFIYIRRRTPKNICDKEPKIDEKEISTEHVPLVPNIDPKDEQIDQLNYRIDSLEHRVLKQEETISNLTFHLKEAVHFQRSAMDAISSLQNLLELSSEEEEERSTRKKRRQNKVKRVNDRLDAFMNTFSPPKGNGLASIYEGSRSSLTTMNQRFPISNTSYHLPPIAPIKTHRSNAFMNPLDSINIDRHHGSLSPPEHLRTSSMSVPRNSSHELSPKHFNSRHIPSFHNPTIPIPTNQMGLPGKKE